MTEDLFFGVSAPRPRRRVGRPVQASVAPSIGQHEVLEALDLHLRGMQDRPAFCSVGDDQPSPSSSIRPFGAALQPVEPTGELGDRGVMETLTLVSAISAMLAAAGALFNGWMILPHTWAAELAAEPGER